MGKKRNYARNRRGLQALTLCISTALVLILLGLIVFSVLSGRNLSSYVKENLVVTMMFDQDMTNPEAQQICKSLNKRQFIKQINYISKEQSLKEAIKSMGTNPAEFTNGVNPFPSSVELTLKSDYANNDSLRWISAELHKYPKVSEITYQKDLVEEVNNNLAKIGLVLLVLAILLTFVSFSLISNTIRLGIYSRRFSIHTMKLVGASWGFIRRPFVRDAVLLGLLAALFANIVLGCGVFALYNYEPGILTFVTWQVLAITCGSVFFFGIILTALCSNISVNKFLRMKAGELYNF